MLGEGPRAAGDNQGCAATRCQPAVLRAVGCSARVPEGDPLPGWVPVSCPPSRSLQPDWKETPGSHQTCVPALSGRLPVAWSC